MIPRIEGEEALPDREQRRTTAGFELLREANVYADVVRALEAWRRL
jgi:hypothetical protein